jgi:hypothetical protein
MNIGPNVSPAPVFTASFDGMYSFAIEPNDYPNQVLDINGTFISGASTIGGSPGLQVSYVVYLREGDVVSYQGIAADLFCTT